MRGRERRLSKLEKHLGVGEFEVERPTIVICGVEKVELPDGSSELISEPHMAYVPTSTGSETVYRLDSESEVDFDLRIEQIALRN